MEGEREREMEGERERWRERERERWGNNFFRFLWVIHSSFFTGQEKDVNAKVQTFDEMQYFLICTKHSYTLISLI